MTEDSWIKSHSLLSPEKTHALGFLSLIWAACEARTHEMFKTVTGLSTQTARIVTHDVGHISIWIKTVEIAREKNASEDFIAHLDHLRLYNQRCRQNRNQFVHFGLGMPSDDKNLFGLIRTTGFSEDIEYINDSLEEIRRVCDDCQKFIQYYWEVVGCHVAEEVPQLPSPSWPAKPILPQLVWRRPPRVKNAPS